MTSRVQRLDQPRRARRNVIATISDRARVDAFGGRAHARFVKTFMMAAALALPSTAHSAGAPASSLSQDAPAAPAPAAPAQVEAAQAPAEHATTHRRFGLVRYDRPVYHHGVRVLWHGAWRDEPAGAAAATRVRPGQPASGRDILVMADSADPSATRMAVEFAGAVQGDGLRVKAVSGKTSPAALEKAVSGDAADLAVVSMDALGDSSKAAGDDRGDWRARIPYLVRLANEPIMLIAPRAITDIQQLAGRKVNVAAADGATAASAAIVFSRLNVAPTTTNEALPEALARLTRGEIDAVFVVGADDSQALAEFGKDGRFHVVAIPYAPALQALYCPMRLTSRDQVNLISQNDKVDTIGVPTALLAIDAAPSSPRAERIAPVAQRLFALFDQSLGALPVSKWKDVNLAARILGWPRFGATQAWLEQNKGAPNAALDTFRGAAEIAAGAGEAPSGADSDKLYESLMKLSGAAQ